VIDVAANGIDGLHMASHGNHDLIVLDAMLPGIDGLEVLRRLKHDQRLRPIPVLIASARGEETDIVAGLELGADDYVTKPFSPRELVGRVRAVLRRASGGPPAEVMRVGDLTLDRNRYIAITPDGEKSLTPTEFELLAAMANQPGRIFTRSQLLIAVRGVAFESYERAIDSHIRNLRKKIEPSEGNPKYIITVHGVGYKFVEE